MPYLFESHTRDDLNDFIIEWIRDSINKKINQDVLFGVIYNIAIIAMPILAKIENNHPELFAKITSLNLDGMTLLAQAIESNSSPNFLHWLFEKGCDIHWHANDDSSHTLVHFAAANNSLTALQKIKELHPDLFRKIVNAPDVDGLTPLALAVKANRPSCAEWLLQNRGDIKWHSTDDINYRLSHLAAENNAVDILKLFKSSSSLVFQRIIHLADKDGFTPLAYAALHKHAESIHWIRRELPASHFDENALTVLLPNAATFSTCNSEDYIPMLTFFSKQLVTAISHTFQSNFCFNFGLKVAANLVENGVDLPDETDALKFALQNNIVLMFASLLDTQLKNLIIDISTNDNHLCISINNNLFFIRFFAQEQATAKLKGVFLNAAKAAVPNLPKSVGDKIADEMTTMFLRHLKTLQPESESSQSTASATERAILEVYWQGDISNGMRGTYGLITMTIGEKSYDFKPPKENVSAPMRITSLQNTNQFSFKNPDTIKSLSLKVYIDTPYRTERQGTKQANGTISFQEQIRREETYVRFERDNEEILMGHTYQLIIRNENDSLIACIVDKNKIDVPAKVDHLLI